MSRRGRNSPKTIRTGKTGREGNHADAWNDRNY